MSSPSKLITDKCEHACLMLILFSYLLSLSPSLFFLFFSFTGTLWPLMGGLLKSVLHYNVCLSENRNCSSLVITSSSIETVSILFRCLHFLCVSFFFHLLPLLNWHPLLQKIKNKKIERKEKKKPKNVFCLQGTAFGSAPVPSRRQLCESLKFCSVL